MTGESEILPSNVLQKAGYRGSKCSRFNSKYLCSSTEAVNAFSQD